MIELTTQRGKAGTFCATISQTKPYPTKFCTTPIRLITQIGKISHKLPGTNPILSPRSLATPSIATCLWLYPMVLLITGDILPNKYPIPAHDWIHIAHTKTSHLSLKKALNLSCKRCFVIPKRGGLTRLVNGKKNDLEGIGYEISSGWFLILKRH